MFLLNWTFHKYSLSVRLAASVMSRRTGEHWLKCRPRLGCTGGRVECTPSRPWGVSGSGKYRNKFKVISVIIVIFCECVDNSKSLAVLLISLAPNIEPFLWFFVVFTLFFNQCQEETFVIGWDKSQQQEIESSLFSCQKKVIRINQTKKYII